VGTDQPAPAGGGDRPIGRRDPQCVLVCEDVLEEPGEGSCRDPVGVAADASADGGMMGMQPIKRLEIPAGGTVELKAGSYHIMMIGLKQDLKPGDTIEIILTFEKAGEVKVNAAVRES